MTHNKKIISVLACHNRKKVTKACISRLKESSDKAGLKIDVILVDDGSTDDTSIEVSKMYPGVHIIYGDGTLYWNQGMRVGIDCAIEQNADYIVLLNDDTYLYDDAITKLFNYILESDITDSIVTGTLVDPDSGELTYGGRYSTSFFHPLRFDGIIKPEDKNAKVCQAVNGNLLVIPQTIYLDIGNLSDDYQHSKGDFDYGLRARLAGYKLLVAPGIFGTCYRNSDPEKPSQNMSVWSDVVDYATNPKRMPIKERICYFRKFGNIFWFVYIPLPYIRFMFKRFFPYLVRK